MILLKKTYQHRRDFAGIYECENCHFTYAQDGYDDRNFHDNVVPSWKCPECEKSTNDLKEPIQKIETRYEEGFQV